MRQLLTRRGVPVLLSLVLSGCGGGGGGGNGNPSDVVPFEPLAQGSYPSGARIDVAELNLFPFSVGDTVSYERIESSTVDGNVTRAVTSPEPASGLFNVTESDSTSTTGPDITRYQLGTIGPDFHVMVIDPLGASGTAPGLYAAVNVLHEYTAPLYAVGGTRLLEYQGDMEADADGDGLSDSYRLVYAQVFRGFETMDILGGSRQLAHFTNTIEFTIRGTATGDDVLTAATEDTFFAPGIGLVRRDAGPIVVDGSVVQRAYSIRAISASVSGVSYP